MDARSYTTAVANRARGGGCECPEYYPSCEIQFMNLANIHSIRKSFHALRQLCMATADQQKYVFVCFYIFGLVFCFCLVGLVNWKRLVGFITCLV